MKYINHKRKNRLKNNKGNLRNILDKNYFHIYEEVSPYEADIWKIYYSNLPTSIYFLNKNEALLSSDKNSIKDIYKLKALFEREKEKVMSKNFYEYYNIYFEFEKCALNFKYEYINTIIDIFLVSIIIAFINALYIKSLGFGILFFMFAIAIISICKFAKINKKIKKYIRRVREKYLREKIRKEGLIFVDKLRRELE